jgi:hypothetical protein
LNANVFELTELYKKTHTGIETKTRYMLKGRDSVNLDFHIHEEPLVAADLVAVREVVQGCQLEANPAKILDKSIHSPGMSVSIETGDEAGALEVGVVAKFEECHEPATC